MEEKRFNNHSSTNSSEECKTRIKSIKKITYTESCPVCKYEHSITEWFANKVISFTDGFFASVVDREYEEFIKREENNGEFEMVTCKSESETPIDILGMFCPNCGVLLKFETCSSKTEEVVEQ